MPRTVCLLTCATILIAPASNAQSTKSLSVDMRSAGHATRSLAVDDDVPVVVEIRKTTFQSCTVDTKAERLAPAPNPIGQALAVLSPFIGVAARATTRVAAPPGAEVLDRQLASLEADAASSLREVNTQRQTARDTLLSLPSMLACSARACDDVDVARTRLASVRSAVAGVVDAVAAPVAILNARAAALNKAVIEKAAAPGEETWSQDALGRIDGIQRTLDAIADRRTAIGKAREALSPVLERIETYTPSTTDVVPLAVARRSKTTVTVICLNAVTLEPMVYRTTEDGVVVVAEEIPPVTTTVVYQDMPWAFVTAGVLYSQIDKRQVGVGAFRTGTDAGAATFERRVTETDHADTQIVPFSFLDIALCRCRKWTPAAAIGIGVNPNNGGNVLEYFVGGGLVIDGQVAIQVGRHLGSRQEPTNGFAEGDLVPDKLTTIPTVRRRAGGLGIGLTFRIPLPK